MRLWSIHPKYLDTRGLVALWREGLLAKHVLEGKTKGYRNHPQLNRFKEQEDPVHAIHYFLCKVHEEAANRNYKFDETKLNWDCKPCTIQVTNGQVDYEIRHLKKKLMERDPGRFKALKPIREFEVHPMFIIIPGKIEDWEIQ
ncbi:MAG TPA: pyrimidine dimer DNA glycosylase/endonuclease V [Flavisolibacter sp.]